MTAKQFFKSTAFKCVITLLCVLLVSGIFLTVMNSLLAVTDQERFDRAIKKIYGKPVTTVAVTAVNYNDNANVEEAYKVTEDDNYLIKVTGFGGYDGGTVTCWVVVNVTNGAVKGIDKVIVDSNKGQTQMAEINNAFLTKFSTGYEDGIYYSPNGGFVVTGSTRTSTAICNAVNGALDFANAMCGNVVQDIYKDNNFEYREAIDTRNTKHTVNDREVTYTVMTNGYGMAGEFTIEIKVSEGAITAYNVVVNGSTSGYESEMDDGIKNGSWFIGKNKDDILNAMGGSVEYGSINGGLSSSGLKTGATQSSYQCIYAAVFATANYELALTTGGSENE